VDWDNDGDNDLLVGENNGQIRYFQNIGTASSPSLHYVGLLQAGGVNIDVGDYSTVWTDDWNEDGLVDVIAGDANGLFRLYLNQGTPTSPNLRTAVYLTLAAGGNVDVGYRSGPNVVDLNGDGVKDLVSGEMSGKVYYYQNNGTNANPQLAAGVYLNTGALPITTPGTTRIATVDWNNDGDMDLVAGSYDPRLKYYLQAAVTPPAPTIDMANVGSSSIPGGGGSYNFNITVNNASSTAVTCDVWTCQSSANYGPFSAPLLVRNDVTFNPSSSLMRNITQYVPGTVPMGFYYHYGHIGNQALNQVYSQDYVYFYKVSSDGCSDPVVHDWACTGWPEDPAVYVSPALPTTLTLSAAPNPFNPVTTVSYSLPQAGPVEVMVYNAAGKQVASLVSGWREAGSQQVTWDATGLPSGVYLVKVAAGNAQQVQKLTLLK